MIALRCDLFLDLRINYDLLGVRATELASKRARIFSRVRSFAALRTQPTRVRIQSSLTSQYLGLFVFIFIYSFEPQENEKKKQSKTFEIIDVR